jgi:hypothetical protein
MMHTIQPPHNTKASAQTLAQMIVDMINASVTEREAYASPVKPPPPHGMSVGPDCGFCGDTTQRTGSCFTCVSCGQTTGCG